MLLTIIVVLLIVGVVLWLINSAYLPIDVGIKRIVSVVIVLTLIVWLLLVVLPAVTGHRLLP